MKLPPLPPLTCDHTTGHVATLTRAQLRADRTAVLEAVAEFVRNFSQPGDVTMWRHALLAEIRKAAKEQT